MESRAHPAAYRRRKWICASGEEVRRDVDVKRVARLTVSIDFDVDRVLEQGQTAIDLFDVDTAIEQLPQPRQVLVLNGKVRRCHLIPLVGAEGICVAHVDDVGRSTRGLVGRLHPDSGSCGCYPGRRHRICAARGNGALRGPCGTAGGRCGVLRQNERVVVER